MSKNNKNKKKQNREPDVFMQIGSDKTDEKIMLKVPSHYKYVLNRLMADTACKDYHNSQEMLQFFCELFTELDHKDRSFYEVLLNSKVAKVRTISDLVTLVLQRHKYYRLVDVTSKEKLGEFYILAARKNNLEEWIANSDIDDAYEVGKRIMEIEHGKFYKNNYIGMYRFYVENETDD